MIVVLHDWDYSEQYVDSWVREQLINLGLNPDGVDSAKLWSCTLIQTNSEQTTELEHVGSEETHVHEVPEWLVAYILEGFVEYTDPDTGGHTTLLTCPSCYRLTDEGVCPHCGADTIHDTPEAVFQTAEEMENWLGADTPGMVVQFRCGACDQFFGVEGAIRHAQETGHKQFHRA
jgi:predicted RNA-binding Zn-ribbon protein involved in translation (DUF1610 family)